MSEPQPYIAHFDLDSFFVSVELINNPSLRGKPVLVGSIERGVVATCSYEARKFGIHSAMPMKRALQLCPQAIVTNASRHQYGKYSRWVTELIAEKVPLFEKASIDEFYVDLTGMDRFFGASKFAQELRKHITAQTGLPLSCGLASARFIAKMATNQAKPNGFLQIKPGQEKEFLWPLSIDKINGVGEQTAQLLKSKGLYTIEDIARTPVAVLSSYVGKWGESLWEKSQGIGSAVVYTEWEQKSVSHEQTFDQDYTDPVFLQQQIVSLCVETAADVRSEEKLAGCITVKIKYGNFDVVSKQETIDYTALDDVITAKAKLLFQQLYQPGRPVRLLGVRCSHLVPINLQMSLFEKTAEKLQLYQTMDEINERYGKDALTKAAILPPAPREKEP
ncbi:MAG: DNA polymerase IV [Sphingomonadales bacterium]|nr:DNA polymerase IV [Sphingomonadales bacterium]